jgi:Nucleoside 2-deoxyribosyltransferase
MTDVMFAHITSTSWASLRDLLLQRSQDASGSAMSDAPEPRLQSSHMRASPEGFDAALAAGLRALGHEVWVPQESEQQQTTAKAIFDSDVRGIDWSEVVVACMDGADPDSGTCWEIGSVWRRKPTVLYRTDIRSESLPLGPAMTRRANCGRRPSRWSSVSWRSRV